MSSGEKMRGKEKRKNRGEFNINSLCAVIFDLHVVLPSPVTVASGQSFSVLYET